MVLRKFWMVFLRNWLLLLALSGCSPSTVEDLRYQGECETRKLALELKAIDSKEDLVRALPRIKKRYNRLADLLILAKNFKEKEMGDPSLASEELFAELARLYEIPGGRELVESAQEEAIRKLDRKIAN